MLVMTREAAVWVMAYSPALLEVPRISFEYLPVTSSGGYTAIPLGGDEGQCAKSASGPTGAHHLGSPSIASIRC